jgi:hypothetical protein
MKPVQECNQAFFFLVFIKLCFSNSCEITPLFGHGQYLVGECSRLRSLGDFFVLYHKKPVQECNQAFFFLVCTVLCFSNNCKLTPAFGLGLNRNTPMTRISYKKSYSFEFRTRAPLSYRYLYSPQSVL